MGNKKATKKATGKKTTIKGNRVVIGEVNGDVYVTTPGGRRRLAIDRADGTRCNAAEKLDASDHGFTIAADAIVEPPDRRPASRLAGDVVLYNVCNASSQISADQCNVPTLGFTRSGMYFNDAACRAYGLHARMKIYVTITPDMRFLRVVLAQEHFPRENDINKFGAYQLVVDNPKRRLRDQPVTVESDGRFTEPQPFLRLKVESPRLRRAIERYDLAGDYFGPYDPRNRGAGRAARLYADPAMRGPNGKYNCLYIRLSDVYDTSDFRRKEFALFRDVQDRLDLYAGIPARREVPVTGVTS